MRRCIARLQSISPYSQSAQHNVPKLDRELAGDHDERTWRDKCTVNKDGIVCIPAMGLKQCIDTAAYKLGVKVPGRRAATYKGFFTSGFLCEQDVPIANGKPLTKKDADMVLISANADGVRGSGKRVPRRFPVFPEWTGEAQFTITDDIITPDIFEHHLRAAGVIVGIGRFRPEKGGTNGRFKVLDVKWEEMEF